MAKNKVFNNFKLDLFTLLKSYNTNNNLIGNKITNDIKELFNKLEIEFTNCEDNTLNFINKLNLRKEKESNNSHNIITDINNKFLMRNERIRKIHKNNIFNINDKIYKLQKENEEKIIKLETNHTKLIKANQENFSIIEEAKDININSLKKRLNKIVEDYNTFLNEKSQETTSNIQKIHSYYSKQIIISNEEESPKLLDILNQIKELEHKITLLNEKFINEKNTLLLNKREINTTLNNNIREKTNEKTNAINTEKLNHIIKQKDIRKQLEYYEDEYNNKTNKIFEDYLELVNQYTEQQKLNEDDYKNNLLKTKRYYFYNYYDLTFNLNNYLSSLKKESFDSLKLKFANRKLHKLKIKDYYQKIKELKTSYQNELKILDEKYNQSIKHYNLSKEIAEVNKNYELSLARIELNTMKANNNLLSSYITKQIDTNISNIENEFEYQARALRSEANINIEKNNREITSKELKANLAIYEIKNQISNLKALKIRVEKEINLKVNYLSNQSKREEMLERIVANLELDRNQKLNELNIKRNEINETIINAYKDLEIDILNEKLEFCDLEFKHNKKLLNTSFSLNRLPYALEIDINKIKEKAELNYENHYYEKNSGLCLLDYNRKNYRFDTLLIATYGKFLFNILTKIYEFYTNFYNLILPKLKDFNQAYINLFKNVSQLTANLYLNTIKEFNTKATLIIEERIQKETRLTYKDNNNNLLITYNNQKTYLENKINSINTTIKQYDNTLKMYIDKIKDVNKTIKSKKNNHNILNNLLSYEILGYKNVIKDYKGRIKDINKRKHNLLKLIKQLDKKLKHIKNIYDKSILNNDKALKNEYRSSYLLVYKANDLINNVETKLNTLYNKTFNIKKVNKLTNPHNLIHKVDNIIKELQNDYLLFFKDFKNKNEIKYYNLQRKIISTFKNNLYKEKQKMVNNIKMAKRNSIKTKNKIKKIINNNNQSYNNSLIDYKNRLNFIKDKHINKIALYNHKNKTTCTAYINNIASITNNISYLRYNHYINNKQAKLDYKKGLDEIKENYLNEVKNNNGNLFAYKDRIENNLKSLPINLIRNISEIKHQQKEFKKSYLNLKNKNISTKKNIKKAYEKGRISNITLNTTKMVREKYMQNKNLKFPKRKEVSN